MSFVTVPAEYSNGVIKTFEKVREKPVRVMVTFEYREEDNSILKKRMNDFKKGENIFDMSDLNTVMKNRMRIGKYRFKYMIIDEEIIIYFYDAGNRGNIYK